MADDESESDPGSKDSSSQPSTTYSDQETISSFLGHLNQSPREIWNSSLPPSSGPRSLRLKRSENGFGFTLRHFIVYPPESNAILARDRRLGVGSHVIGNDPMDTIFVKNVRENSPASAAGLTTGDRIISVNGEDIAGLSYAKIIQLIHKTGNYLHLLVVPKENDLLQLYFSETAHNPETNQRSRFHSPDSTANVHAKKTCSMNKVAGGMHHYSRSETSPMPLASISGSVERERITSPVRATGFRRCSEGNERRLAGDLPASVCSRRIRDLCATRPVSDTSSCGSSESGPNYGGPAGAAAAAAATCRYSLDAGFGRRCCYDSFSDSSVKDSYGSEDSLIMSRLRKSFEQKEEFMNRLPHTVLGQVVPPPPTKEFYGRPQKLTVPAWPPTAPQPLGNSNRSSEPAAVPSDTGSLKSRNKQNFFSTLDKIHENTSPAARATADGGAQQPFQMVAVRAKQFENGAAVEDKTELYRSELARLTTKHNVANVATRKRDFENRAQIERQSFATRETRSLESANIPSFYSTPGSGNRIIPIGSKHLHCEPPSNFSSLSTMNDVLKNDDLLALKNKPVVRQDSYLAACSKPTIKITRKSDSGEDLVTVSESNLLETLSDKSGEVLDDDKSTRRISYIRATTTGDSMNVDSEYEFSDTEAVVVAPQRRAPRKWRTPLFPGDIQRLRRFFEDLAASSSERGILGSRKTTDSFPDQDQHNVIKEGTVLCKVTQVEGKRAGDRSWKPVWLILRGPFLYLCKERKESIPMHGETPATFDRPDLGASCDRIDIRCSVVEVASNYTKRKHVFRLNAPSVGAELLLQADDANAMSQWVKVLQDQAILPATSTADTMPNISSNVSPSAGSKTFRKFTSLRNRSPTGPSGDSPGNKAKKLAQNEAQQTSPKSKTWKNKMAKQFRRIQPGSSSPNTQATVAYPAGATMGIPLENCPSSSFSEYVPLLVEICTNVVEAKGLEIIGIYRVPGNNAAVSSLTEAVNRGLDVTILDSDPRWSDVNVISSLLKSFFRKLPDALLTSELYPHFIKAEAIEDPILRMTTLRKLVHDLPDHNFETLRYLLFHFKKVVANSKANKMEARNLAIVLGPTLVRDGDDMATMVHNMSHACRIVESLINHVDWCFGDGNIADLKASIANLNSVPELDATSSNHDVLLENIRKVEASLQSPVTAKDLVSTIIGAANRKKQKTTSKHSTASNRKTNSFMTTITHVGSSSEDVLSDNQSLQNSSNSKNSEKKDDEKKSMDGQKRESEQNTETQNSVTNVEAVSDVVDNKGDCNNSGNAWTYANLTASTQERIRRFEQETKAMLQRELTRQKRSSEYGYDEVAKERPLIKSKDDSSDMQPEQLTCSLLSDKCSGVMKIEPAAVSNDHSICDNPPPVIVMRRNLPNVNGKNVTTNNDNSSNSNNLKRLKTSGEFVQDNSLTRSGSLDSLNCAGRPSSHVSDDGGDLLMSLTSTFDRKLKSLNEERDTTSHVEENVSLRKRNSFNGHSVVEDGSLYRDPSLHKTFEKTSKMMDIQNKDCETNKEDKDKKEKKDVEDMKENRSCVTCGCSMKHTEAVQQNCDNWKRTVLQETRPENRQQENVVVLRREPKLFHSNSVKLRRSESLKEDNGSRTKLHRSGSLNKPGEPKFSRLESWILTKNAEATKLKRSDSLTKSEKTETNMLKRRQMEQSKKARSEKEGKIKRRNGTKNGIKRRHTVGGTKDFDKVTWLQSQQRENNKENRKERRTSSPDLSSTRMADFLIEVVVRPRSIISVDGNFISRLLNIPLESQV